MPREVNQGYAATSAAFYLATFLGYEELRRSQEVTS